MPRPASSGEKRGGVQLDLEPGPASGDTLVAAALKILRQTSSDLKAAWTQRAAELWRNGLLQPPSFDCRKAVEPRPPDTPARDPKVPL